MLELRDVHTYYGESHILNGVSLRIAEGEAVGLLGRNGAGKTTTIRSIVGMTPPRMGDITFLGHRISGRPSHEIAKAGVGLVPQGRRIFRSLSVKENLLMSARTGGGWTLERAYNRFPRLKERESNYGDQLSGGEQQMLAIARALLTSPRMLLLDEPSEGLAPMIVREIGEIIADLKREGIAFLLVEQNLSMAFNVVDRLYVMNKGQIVFEGTPKALLADEALHRQYLGV